MKQTNSKTSCYHCGDDCPDLTIAADNHYFCCTGCKTVYEIFSENGLEGFYLLNDSPGQQKGTKKSIDYSHLKNSEVTEKLLDFSDDGINVVTLFLPAIHCSSCVYLLENLQKLHSGIVKVVVNFPKRQARITFKSAKISLYEVAVLLDKIGYEPNLSLESTEAKAKKDYSLLYQLGVSGFVFGNTMIMALPEYFDMNDTTLKSFAPFFRGLMLVLSIPVILYSAKDYFKSAYKGLKNSFINIDVPIALGIIVLFSRSAYEVLAGIGSGYFDSLAGLIFFLLLGKFFQRKTYDSLSFERDYKSYFPLAITVLKEGIEVSTTLEKLVVGDRILVRNQELIPADSILISEKAHIDNRFVTGESSLIAKTSGDKIFAGGKQEGSAIELEVLKTVDQSYLTSLWNNDAFDKDKTKPFKSVTDQISKYFTLAILLLTTIAGAYWFTVDTSMAFQVISSILIVACPCALALSAPFTNGNTLRIFGRNHFFVKNAETVETLGKVNHVVWDKTGTLTKGDQVDLKYSGENPSQTDLSVLKSMARQSNHPLSRLLNQSLKVDLLQLSDFSEIPGQGLSATFEGVKYKLGSPTFVGGELSKNKSGFTWSKDDQVVGKYELSHIYRSGIDEVISKMPVTHQSLLTGDHDGEAEKINQMFSNIETTRYYQKPIDKLNYIVERQKSGDVVAMIGDGLNDAGALQQSQVGISISEDVNGFSPACDAILDAKKFDRIPDFLNLAKKSRQIIFASFILSFAYNTVGLTFAIMGMLSPVVSAILMPLSSISVVVFVTIATNLLAKKHNL